MTRIIHSKPSLEYFFGSFLFFFGGEVFLVFSHARARFNGSLRCCFLAAFKSEWNVQTPPTHLYVQHLNLSQYCTHPLSKVLPSPSSRRACPVPVICVTHTHTASDTRATPTVRLLLLCGGYCLQTHPQQGDSGQVPEVLRRYVPP